MTELNETLKKEGAPTAEPSDSMSLKGGLQGRFSSSFCILQTSVDTLLRLTEGGMNPAYAEKTAPLFAEIERQISYLERLSAHAVELAVGYVATEEASLCSVNLVQALSSLCACVREEMQLRGMEAAVLFDAETLPTANQWVQGDTGLIDGIFLNLISNSLQAGASTITISACADGSVHYQDDGAGTKAGLLRALLVDGHPTGESLANGSLGLLVVHRHATAMGWSIQVEPSEQGTRLLFRDIKPARQEDTAVLKSGGIEDCRSTELTQQRIQHEFGAVFGLRPAPQREEKNEK